MKGEGHNTGSIYHVVTRSISGYKVFNSDDDFKRIVQAFRYYQDKEDKVSLSEFLNRGKLFLDGGRSCNLENLRVHIIAFCVMPTHLHLILKQIEDRGISEFMGKVLNSYSRYFNLKHNRKGPLWEARFKTIPVVTDEQLIHLTRYVHLNPVTAYIAERPEDWRASSYNEFIDDVKGEDNLNFNGITMEPRQYKSFVEEYIPYQRAYAKIKNLVCE